MGKNIDCLFIGHNETQFEVYEKMVKAMGTNTPTYRDLQCNFVMDNNNVATISDIYNKYSNTSCNLSLGNLFSPTIAYLGTFVNKKGCSFDYVNSFQDCKEELKEKLLNNNYLSIIIPTTLYVSPMPLMEIITFVKKYNTTSKIIVGGPFIFTQVKVNKDEETLQYFFKSVNADFYVNSSQGELALSNILYAIKNNMPLDDIDNIYYKSNGKFIKNKFNVEDNKLCENAVEWDLFKESINQLLAVRTSISCPFACSFCAFPEHAGEYQVVDVYVIEKELNKIQSLGNVTSVNFIDDTLNVPTKRFKEILRMMIKNKYTFKWNSHYRCQFADEETVALMKESGCEGVFLGIESGDPDILKNMNKMAKVEDYKKGIALLKKYGIITYTSFIIGFPGETEETARNTINFIKETKPDFFRTQLWYCDPITPIWKERERYEIENSQFHWKHKTMTADRASDIINEVFMNMEESIWLPQYNFEFAGIFNLLHRGMSLDEIKRLVKIFNNEIKEKFNNPNKTEISKEVIEEIKSLVSCKEDEKSVNIDEKYNAEFDI